MDDFEGSRSLVEAAVFNSSWTEAAEGRLSERAQLLLEILIVLMCLGAVTGNILVIVIVAATKTLHSVTSVLIMNLAISDLLVGIGVMPFVALSIMEHRWVDCTDLCLFVGYTSSVYLTASALTLAAIALDRYYSIMDCLRYSSRCTLWRTCAVVLWIWLQALAISSPPLLGWSSVSYVVPMYSCAVNWSISPSYTTCVAALSYLIPTAVILFCYANIVKVARSHARRIHTLEDSVQRSRNPCASFTPGDASHQHCGSPWRLNYHINGEFMSQASTEERDVNPVPPEATQQSTAASRLLFSFRSWNSLQPPVQSSQQHHHGVRRLLLVISGFLLCWTPYISVALAQATTALVPPFAITFSYWLVLLNSDINPLLYALLSKRFQSALQGLWKKMRAHLGSVVGRGEDVRNSDPCTLSTPHPSSQSSKESLTCDNSKYSSSIFTVSAGFKCHSENYVCKVCHGEHASSSSVRQDAGGDKRHNLQVPARPQEGSRLPFSALTNEPEATFIFGQITVSVQHDVC
ncbi:5-hydroxytryptamine receptor 1D isoform 1-T1 [Odontesthes bonariensis]|uniref:5-hydroxytryptamine receptor 1D isoform X1 n=2 Tax=Odontesthes bonariensis TaxID=219752 RepID=UPI003F58D15E